MSVSTQGFLPQGININSLMKYLKDNYTEVRLLEGSDLVPHHNHISFLGAKGEQRTLSVYTYRYDGINEGYPCHMKPNVSVSISVGKWGHSRKIITGILANFGGGFFRYNDCEDDWIFVEGKENLNVVSENERRLLLMISDDNDGKVNAKEYEIVNFVMKHLKEIKELE